MTKTTFFGLLAFIAVSAGACRAYDSDLIENGAAGVPARPASSTSSPDDAVEVTFALRGFSLDQAGDRWERFGLDLDGFQTEDVAESAECVAENGNSIVDGNKGIDNSFGRSVLPTLDLALGCLEDNIALHQGQGEGTILVRVRNWNGEPDDASVDVAVFAAVDGTSLDDVSDVEWGGSSDTVLFRAGGQLLAPDPIWDGNDYFFVDPEGLLVEGDLDRPTIGQGDAYIADDRIVVSLNNNAAFLFPTGLGSFSFALRGFLLADISEDRETLTKGLLAGRTAAERLLGTLEPLGLCDDSVRGVVANLITDNLDLRADPEIGTSSDVCSAMGVAFSFRGTRANIADQVAPASLPVPQPCATAEPGEPTVDLCCVSVAEESPEVFSAECNPSDRSLYEGMPIEIPVPIETGF